MLYSSSLTSGSPAKTQEKSAKKLLAGLLVVIALSQNEALASSMTFQMPYTPRQFITENVINKVSPELKKLFGGLAAIFALHSLIKR